MFNEEIFIHSLPKDISSLNHNNYREFFKSFSKYSPYKYVCSAGATKITLSFPSYPFVLKIPFSNCSLDFCNKEVQLYKASKAFNISFLFAETALIAPYVYKQPLCLPLEDNCSSSNPTTPYFLDSKWIEETRQFYGNEILKRFFSFLKTYSIEDLHSGNIGYLLDDKENPPIVFDYGGLD